MRQAHRTIITSTGYRKRARCPDTLYADESKTHPIIGSVDIANAFGRNFRSNHELTVNNSSVMQEPVDKCCHMIEAAPIRINFGGEV